MGGVYALNTLDYMSVASVGGGSTVQKVAGGFTYIRQRRKIQERPERFILNRQHPLYGRTLYAGFGNSPGGLNIRDSSVNRLDSQFRSNVATNHRVRTLNRNALKFVAANIEYIKVGNQPGQNNLFGNLSFNKGTLATWMNIPNATLVGFIELSPTSANNRILFYINGTNISFYLNGVGVGAVTPPPFNTWYHVCVTWFDGNNATVGAYVYIYINGILKFSNRTANAFISPNILRGFWIGSALINQYPMTGYLADVYLSNDYSPPAIVSAFADPSNVMLEVGTKPFILPSTRQIFPVAGTIKAGAGISDNINYETTLGLAKIANNETINYEVSSTSTTTPIKANEFINYETLGKLLNGERIDYDASQKINRTEILDYDASQKINRTEILDYDASQKINRTEILDYDASQKINRTEILDYEDAQKLSKQQIINYTSSQSLYNKEILDYEVKKPTTSKEIINYDDKQTITVTRPEVLNYMVGAQIINTERLIYEASSATIITPVNRNEFINYEVGSKLIRGEILDYNINSIVVGKDIINYAVNTSITAITKAILNYMVKQGVLSAERLIYEASSLTVVYPVSCNELLNYEVKKTLIKPGTSNYNTLSKQIIIGSADYETLSRILNKSTFDYTVLQGVQSKNLPVVYNTVQGIGLFGGLDYNTIMRISSKSVLNYEVNKIIQAHTYAILSYQILHALINYGIECYEVDGTIFVINPYTKNIYSLDTLFRNIELDTLNRTWVLDQLNRTFVL